MISAVQDESWILLDTQQMDVLLFNVIFPYTVRMEPMPSEAVSVITNIIPLALNIASVPPGMNKTLSTVHNRIVSLTTQCSVAFTCIGEYTNSLPSPGLTKYVLSTVIG